MPVRIYALAKQLRIDKQALFDACPNPDILAITIKPPAPKSDDDDEVVDLVDYPWRQLGEHLVDDGFELG